jgi:AraC-like DNA-binding protein
LRRALAQGADAPLRRELETLAALGFATFRPQPGRITMPDVNCDFVWADERVIAVGPMTRARPGALRVGQEAALISVDPIAAQDWLGVPLAELTDKRVPLGEIDRGLSDALAAAFFFGQAHRLVRRQKPRTSRIETAFHALCEGGSVRQAADASAWSERQLQRVFEQQMGLAPKLFARIARLRRAMQAFKRRGETLAGSAALAGFVDQPHFNREMRALTGGAPLAILPHVGNFQYISDSLP